MKKLIFVFLLILIAIEFINIKNINCYDDKKISFSFKKGDLIKTIDIGKGKFENFSFNLIKKDENFELRVKGKGDLEFNIIFNGFKKIFPFDDSQFLSPLYVFEKENQIFMFSIDYSDLHYFKFLEKENTINYNLYLKGKENLKFRIDQIKSLSEAFIRYYEIYKIRERKVDQGGLIIPNISLTTIINSIGIGNINIKYRIVDPKELYAPERIMEGTKYKMKNFVIFDPIKISFENLKDKDFVKNLYFDENILNKQIGIEILTSSIKDKDGNLISIVKKSETTYKIEQGEKVPDYKENSFDKIIFLNPDPNHLKNKGLNPFDNFYSRYIYPLNIAITKMNRELEIKGENEAKYVGLAIDFSNIGDFMNFDKKNFTKNPISFIDGKVSQSYISNCLELLKYLNNKTLILSINPNHFQLLMNSDLIYKEIENIDYIENLPIERVLVPNRPIFFSFRLKDSEINEDNLNKIFNFSLLYGIYPTFWKSKDEPFSIWDNPKKLKLLLNYKNYYEIISEIENEPFKGSFSAKIENGEIYQFGEYPNIYFTFSGYGKIYIDKSILKENDFIILDPIENEEINYKEDENEIIIDSFGLSVINIKSKKGKDLDNKVSLILSNFENKNKSILFLIFPILFLFINLILRKTRLLFKKSYTFLLIILFITHLSLNHFFNISSPYLLFLSIGLYFLFTSLYSLSTKRLFLLNISLIFFITSIVFYLINGNQILSSPPYYLFYNTYFISLILSILIFIFYHFNWKRFYDFMIFLILIILMFLTNILSNPFYSPPIEFTFLISLLSLTFIIFLLTKNFKKIFLMLVLIFLNLIYIFIDKIFYYLLSKKIFISIDFVPNLIFLFLLTTLLIYFYRRDFITKPKFIFTSLILFLIFISLYLNRTLIITPNIFNIIASIIKLIFYIILIIYLIFFVESSLIKKEEWWLNYW